MLWFISNEKNFEQDKKFSRRNNRWLYGDPKAIPTVIHTPLPSIVKVMEVVKNEEKLPHFILPGLRVNADAHGAVDKLSSK